jgi:hypothetical protein
MVKAGAKAAAMVVVAPGMAVQVKAALPAVAHSKVAVALGEGMALALVERVAEEGMAQVGQDVEEEGMAGVTKEKAMEMVG